jgi:Family of unknown function (DUF5939)
VSETEALFGVSRQSANAGCAAAIEGAATNAPDHELCRVNALAFATKAGFRHYWRWKSRRLGGRPLELRALIRRMSIENPLWGAPRIHGELLKLGFEVAQSSVAKYMVKRRGPPSQGWSTLSAQAPAGGRCHGFVRRADH